MKSESRIQTEINMWGRGQGYIVNKNMACSTAGWPDVTIIFPNGLHIYLEIKTDSGRLSKIQEHVHEKLRGYGCYVHTVRSLSEVKEILGEYND